VARSGGGGWHLLYAPTGLGNRVGLLPGVDWRGRDGLIVAPPSQHTSGTRYTWVRPLTAALPEVPAALRRLLAPPATARTTLPPATPASGRGGGYGPAALARERQAVATAPTGRRNATCWATALLVMGAALLVVMGAGAGAGWVWAWS
jgi:hypothetical protein